MHPPPPPFVPLSATVRYPPGRVPDVQDAVPVARETVRGPRRRRWTTASAVRVSWRWPQLTRSRVAAGLLGVFLGGLGLHRMYLGYWRRGLTMLAITVVGGFFTLGLAAIVMGVWGFAEGLLYLSVRRGRFSRDARGRPLRG
ncbi:NINE protein [Cellulomonas humilata]|uniref:NINE protein n=2 Tax=Cellulomonas humilata TaxID=144055 RepID=A0A7Y6A3V2_9CELL|nr:NINE protein [Cellulomonas humilata]NUU19115.1 NINE protein [Cellulomonas humilata]